VSLTLALKWTSAALTVALHASALQSRMIFNIFSIIFNENSESNGRINIIGSTVGNQSIDRAESTT
jgi:hypothetical protein